MRRLALALLLCGCPEGAKPVEHAATPVAAPAPVVDAGPPPPPAAPPPAPEPAQVEVAFKGKVDAGKLKPARIVLVVTKNACAADSAELEMIEQTDVNVGELLNEISFPVGTVAHLCAYAFDKKGQTIGFWGYPKNPVTFEGQGQIELKDLVVKVASVKVRAAPKGM